MDQVMVDLETLGNGSNAVIIAIGAVEFEATSSKLGREFYCVVDGQSCVDAGMKVDVSTVMWWMKQDTAARAAFNNAGEPLPYALQSFAAWLPTGACVWGNGATFDNVILSNAYRAIGLPQPWPFWGDRCYRTLKSLDAILGPEFAAPPLVRGGTYHNALDDARTQALHLWEIVQSIRGHLAPQT